MDMPIAGKMKAKPHRGVLERQASRAPSGLLALALSPMLAPALVLGYTYFRYKGLSQIDPVLYPMLALPPVVGLVLYTSLRRKLRQIASVSEAVQLASSGQATPTELLVAESDVGPARGWNTLVKSHLSGLLTDTAAPVALGADRTAFAGVAMDAMMQAVLAVDRTGAVLVANSAALVYFDRSAESLRGTDLASLLTGEGLRAFQDVMQGRVQRRNGVDLLRPSDGSEGEEILRLTVIPTREAQPIYAVITIEDVTRQRMAEKSRHDFLAQATHELRTPLTNIRLYVEEAIEAGDANPSSRAEALNVISHESLRLERLVSELLDISELEAGARVMDKGDVRVEQLMAQLEADYSAMAEGKSISLTFELPPKVPVLQGDRDKIAGALHNLLGNAIKYTPQGGSVTVRIEEEDGVLRFVFIDTGIGISRDEQTRVFEKFYRSPDQRVTEIEGTGLGLAFAYQVAQMHGGELSLESELDHGSTFTFSMPKPKLAA